MEQLNYENGIDTSMKSIQNDLQDLKNQVDVEKQTTLPNLPGFDIWEKKTFLEMKDKLMKQWNTMRNQEFASGDIKKINMSNFKDASYMYIWFLAPGSFVFNGKQEFDPEMFYSLKIDKVTGKVDGQISCHQKLSPTYNETVPMNFKNGGRKASLSLMIAMDAILNKSKH